MENPPVPVTIYDVAKQAGVGVGTVTRVLNSNAHVSQITRKRVLDVIAQLNFRPSPSPNASPSAKHCPSASSPFSSHVLPWSSDYGASKSVIADSEYDLIVHNIETPARRDAIFRDVAAGHRVNSLHHHLAVGTTT